MKKMLIWGVFTALVIVFTFQNCSPKKSVSFNLAEEFVPNSDLVFYASKEMNIGTTVAPLYKSYHYSLAVSEGKFTRFEYFIDTEGRQRKANRVCNIAGEETFSIFKNALFSIHICRYVSNGFEPEKCSFAVPANSETLYYSIMISENQVHPAIQLSMSSYKRDPKCLQEYYDYCSGTAVAEITQFANNLIDKFESFSNCADVID
ncbi:MAG: hypothetical protein A2622_10940 [Bdellovibrionales bacterium RIFCSPHIGHO2_01_FULL_40_29]|nr:MAG: hypothetical protein A2622_10940 [Bdellovibrionales bacterium RIFCSPHIGHO2_01_FULL_40_29]OFZ34470.1 MAG: hypothetical protein A3D17_01205 [Bdellovibrionales bacterium RIFCSPHIGHO2_02_FULL_40_15]